LRDLLTAVSKNFDGVSIHPRSMQSGAKTVIYTTHRPNATNKHVEPDV